jgi:hypothetical protein
MSSARSKDREVCVLSRLPMAIGAVPLVRLLIPISVTTTRAKNRTPAPSIKSAAISPISFPAAISLPAISASPSLVSFPPSLLVN